MDTRLATWFNRLAALALIAVWFAGPLGAVVKGWMRPAPLQCHCPGHHHDEPAATGPAFAPCDHEAAANVAAAERLMILPGFELPAGQRIVKIHRFTPSAPEIPSYLPETPPPNEPA